MNNEYQSKYSSTRLTRGFDSKDRTNHNKTYRDKVVDGFDNFIKEKIESGLNLYALTVTYTPTDNKFNAEKSTRKRFHNFWWDNFLPDIIFDDKKWIYQYKYLQPYVIIFTEEHESKGVRNRNSKYNEMIFPEKLHHHCLILIDDELTPKLDPYIGENTLNHITKGIMTTRLDKADLNWLSYCTKNFGQKYDVDMYGPRDSSVTLH